MPTVDHFRTDMSEVLDDILQLWFMEYRKTRESRKD